MWVLSSLEFCYMRVPPSWLGIDLQRSIMLGGNMHAIQWDTTVMAQL
jgi:hypothetical protein